MSVLNLRRQAMACACGKGSTTDSQGQIDPALLPLFQQSAGSLMGYQQQNPMTGFSGYFPQQTAQLTGLEREGMGNAASLGQPSYLQGLALGNILNSDEYAGAGPTTGSVDPSNDLSLSSLMSLLSPQSAQIGGSPGSFAPPPLGPAPGSGSPPIYQPPTPGAPNPYYPGPPGGNGPYPNGPISNPDRPNPFNPGEGQTGPGGKYFDGNWPDYAAAPQQQSSSMYAPFMASQSVPQSGGPAWLQGAGQQTDWRRDSQGNPIGPQGQHYTGSQHEFSGGLSPGSPNQNNPFAGSTENIYGDDRSYKDWLAAQNQTNRATSVGLAPTASYGDIVSAYKAKNDAFFAANPERAAEQARIMAQQRGGAPAMNPALIGQGSRSNMVFTPNKTTTTAPPIQPPTPPAGGGPTQPTPQAVPARPTGNASATPAAAAAPTAQTSTGTNLMGGGTSPQSGSWSPAPRQQPQLPNPRGPVPTGPQGPAPDGPYRPPYNPHPWQPGDDYTPNPFDPNDHPPPPGSQNRPGANDVILSGGPSRGAVQDLQGEQRQGTGLQGATPFGQSPGIAAASQRVQGVDIMNDPAVAAALKNFQQLAAPQIQDQAALAGLGHSSALTNSLGQAQASMMTPLYLDALNREQQRLQGVTGATESELARRERSAQNVSQAHQNSINQLMQLQQLGFGQQAGAAQAQLQAGGVQRGVDQAGNEAQYNDMLRRQALSEQAVGMPFGAFAPSALGSHTITQGK